MLNVRKRINKRLVNKKDMHQNQASHSTKSLIKIYSRYVKVNLHESLTNMHTLECVFWN